MAPESVLILDPKQMDHEVLRAGIQEALPGARPQWVPDLNSVDDATAGTARFLITSDHSLPVSVMVRLPKLEVVSLGYTGFDDVQVNQLMDRGVRLYSAPGYATQSVAELNVLLILSLLRRTVPADASTRRGDWDTGLVPGSELRGSTVGIVGTGDIGLATGRLLRAFGCELLGYRKDSSRAKEFMGPGIEGSYADSLADLLARSHFTVLCLPSNPGTDGIIGMDEVAAMKRGQYLVNTARSKLVKPRALRHALQEGILAGAAMDVFDEEPLPVDDPLSRLDGLLLTPHIGYKTQAALDRLARMVTANLGFSQSSDQAARTRNLVSRQP